MRSRTAKLLALLCVPVFLLAACGDDDEPEATGGTDATTTTEPEATSTSAAPAEDVDIAVASTSIGDVLVDAEGLTLYAYANDTAGTPTCTDACANAWPPATVDGEPVVGDGIDDGVVATVGGAGGSTQLTAGGHPLYRYTGDAASGDTSGHGLAEVWSAVAPDGSLVGASGSSTTEY
jgi:predicted lipoprotein with Yx(FWY)xxD motif